MILYQILKGKQTYKPGDMCLWKNCEGRGGPVHLRPYRRTVPYPLPDGVSQNVRHACDDDPRQK